VGVNWGAQGAAMATLIATYLYFIPLVFIGLWDTPINVNLYFSTVIPVVIASAAMGVVLMAFERFAALSASGIISRIIISLLLAGGVYFIAWIMIPGGRKKIKETISDFTFLIKTKQGA